MSERLRFEKDVPDEAVEATRWAVYRDNRRIGWVARTHMGAWKNDRGLSGYVSRYEAGLSLLIGTTSTG